MKAACRSLCCLSLLSLPLVYNVLAVIQFTDPHAGASLEAGSAFDVAWEREERTDLQWPDAVVQFDLFLCAGGNEDNTNEQLTTLIEQGTLEDDGSVSVTVDSKLGAEAPNAYFLRMVLNADDEAYFVIHSDRFTVTGMTGSFSPAVSDGLGSVSGTDGPPSYNSLDKRQAAGAALHDVPYPDQSGAIKYAPMPKAPGTKITIKSAAPLFPTSSYKVAKTFLPTPMIETTISLNPAQTVTSMENTVAAAPDPTDDMEKFLNRWKD